MALIKTNYGLRYNDDGSLCMTIRPDDVPFPGVDSWAVEEGTTNLFSTFLDGTFGSWETYNTGGAAGVREIINDTTFGKVAHIQRTGQSNDGDRWGIHVTKSFSSPTTYTESFYLKILSYEGEAQVQVYNDCVSSSGTGYYGSGIVIRLSDVAVVYQQYTANFQIENIGNGWYRITHTHIKTDVDHGNFLIWLIKGNSDVLIAWPQLEQKPYATSFVDGTRATGNLAVPINPNDFTNFVASTWFKFNSTTSMYPRIFDFGTGTGTENGEWYICVDNSANSVLRWTIHNSSGQNFLYFSQLETGKWYFIVLAFDSPHFKGYLFLPDSTLITKEKTLSEWSPNTSKTKLFIGQNSTQVRALNGIVSNVYFGHYRDKNGNVIWTDDYIKYVYEQKKPFITPPTMPLE